MKVSTNWLKDFVKLSPPFEKIAEDLTMAGLEVKKIEPAADHKDLLFEIEITSNRPDWLSHFGVAREIAAVQNLSLKQVEIPKPVNRPMPQGWKINLKDMEACPYYTGIYIEGIQNHPTPDFIKDRLAACGLRSIHLIVDITNYVLLEMGQPLHAFDADMISGQEIQIRRAKPDEVFLAINNQEFTLSQNDLVIADAARSAALAGIMGGKESEVSARTRNIFLEAAFFHPRFIRQTSRRLGISSDSSYRFERRVDPEGVDLGRERALALIQQYAKPRFVSAMIKAGQKPSAPKSILHLNVNEVAKKLGHSIKIHQIASILTRLGFDAKPDSAENVKVSIPSFRADITENVDLIEEVARIHGFENIPDTLPSRPALSVRQAPIYRLESQARDYFSGIGCYETVTFSLISSHGLHLDSDLAQAVYVRNPQNQDLCWLRPFFWPSFLNVIKKNLSWGAKQIPLFELAHLYFKQAEKLPKEERSLGIAIYGKFREKSWLDSDRDYSYYDLKGMVVSFLREAGIYDHKFRERKQPHLFSPGSEELVIKGTSAGTLGEVHSKILKTWDIEASVFIAELSLETLAAHSDSKRIYSEVPRFPSMDRDLSVLVTEEVKAATIREEIYSLGKGLITSVELFDHFCGGRVPKGCKNLAFHIVYQSLEKTLLSEEIQKLHTEIASTIVNKYQASFQ